LHEPVVQISQFQEIPSTNKHHSTLYGCKILKRTVESMDRFGISPRAASDIINSYLLDTNRVSGDLSDLVSVGKLKRDIQSLRKSKENSFIGRKVKGIGFDGKISDKKHTIFRPETETYVTNVEKKDNITVAIQPKNEYLGKTLKNVHLLNNVR